MLKLDENIKKIKRNYFSLFHFIIVVDVLSRLVL